MKKAIIILLLIIPSVIAWNYETHENIAALVASNLNITLDISNVKEGAIAPDKVFKDNVLHHYPPSYKKAVYWLNLAKEQHSSGNIGQASYSFGIASHYITDSFADPHYVSGESSYQHSKFENRGYYNIRTKCSLYTSDINNSLYLASKDIHWQEWLDSQSTSIPESKMEDATRALYSSTLLTFNASCKHQEYTPIIISSIILSILAAIVAALAILKSYRK